MRGVNRDKVLFCSEGRTREEGRREGRKLREGRRKEERLHKVKRGVP